MPPLSSAAMASSTASRAQAEISDLEAQRDALILQHLSAQKKSERNGDDSSPTIDEQIKATVLAEAQANLARHIKLLGEYNEVRDVGQALMGLIAEQRGVRLVEVMEEFGAGDGE